MKIYGKKWYYGLIPSKENEYKHNLLDEFKLSDVTKHLIVCLKPNKLPGQYELFRTKEGKFHHLFALFDSYLDFYTYMLNFSVEDRNFYEVILGSLPQKPHFDIDISKEEIDNTDDIKYIGDILYQAVIQCSIETLKELSVKINIEKDILIYISHGDNKRSYHIIINNKCHDGNEEAKAFYNTVLSKVNDLFTIKYPKYLKYVNSKIIDRAVYSKKQQFRIMGCQKYGTNRPKRFLEKFKYNNIEYTHKYIEEFRNDDMKKLAILYESLISFVSGCSYIQSLVKPKIYNNYSENACLDDITINRCMKMLKEKMKYCPFSISSVDEEKRTIYLKREAPSYCPICNKREPHENRDPLIYIFKGGVYWNCLRHEKGIPNLYLGDLSMNIIELQNTTNINNTNNNIDNNKLIDSDYEDESEVECYKIPKLNETIGTKQIKDTKQIKEIKEIAKLNESIEIKEIDKPVEQNPVIAKNVKESLSKAVKEAAAKKIAKNNNKLTSYEDVIINSILLICNDK